MTTPETLSLHCPAKVNLALSVGPPDPDRGGLHPIASWMATLDFGDTLELTRLEGGPSTFDLDFADDAPRPQAIDWPLDADLAYRAHAALEAYTGRELPIHARLTKRIPTGSGLGGGSGNAAGMLVGLDRLFALQTPTDDLTSIAASLGSDVVFMTAALAEGDTHALVTGFGESVTPLRRDEPVYLALIFPPHHSPTGRVYGAFDAPQNRAAVDEAAVCELSNRPELTPGQLFNDLAEAAFNVTPELRRTRDAITDAIGHPVHLTGSGAALFVIADDALHAGRLADQITQATDLPSLATRTN